jgi:predicted GNAT family N-acyltransferase
VLREPWTSDKSSERDEREDGSIHLIAIEDGLVSGVGRVHLNSAEEAQVRYMAVQEGRTGKGIGGAILRELEERARVMHASRIVLSAREAARRFYEKHGYECTGQASSLLGIPHCEMRKQL